MIGLVRALWSFLFGDGSSDADLGTEDTRLDMPEICEEWLHDDRRVRWLRDRLGAAADGRSAKQQIGQTFLDVIWAWSEDLESQGISDPGVQHQVIANADFSDWTAAMKRYPPRKR